MGSGYVKSEGDLQIRVRFFSSLKSAIGQSELLRQVPAGTTVENLFTALMEEYPLLAEARERMYIARNHRHTTPETPLADGDELALFPPVSGGASPPTKNRFEIVATPLSADEVAARVAEPEVGAITTFLGTVRDHTGDRHVRYLEYEAYTEMAEPVLARIGEEIKERWPTTRSVAIVHRVGRLVIGEVSVVIAIAASHRKETFAACAYAIDRIKAVVPIWKKEVWTDGEEWIEGPRQPDPILSEAWTDLQPFTEQD